ncbi:flippase [Patescibacteria group bacterium]|nr:flippase [Patescibacteria group bacterium]
MSQERAVARNTAWLMLATLGQKLISFVVFYLIARRVGPEITGKYFYAVSITSIFVILADAGLTPVVIREMAADETRGRGALLRALRLKWVLIPLAILCSLVYAKLAQVEPEVFLAVLVACFVMSADALSLTWYGVLRGKKDLRYEAFGMLICQLITGIVAVLVTVFSPTVTSLVVALLCGSLWNVLWSYLWTRRLMPPMKAIKPWPIKSILLLAWPFGLAGLFVKIYSYLDSLLIRQFQGHEAVGQYAVAYKITYALQFLPLTFVAALYPSMSGLFARGETEELKKALAGSLRLMMFTSVPLAAILSALAPQIILTFYHTPYAGAIAPLTILPWVLIPIFLDFPVGSLLNATHRTALKTMAMGITMVVNAICNILLVPSLGPTGASISAVISFTLLFIVGLWFIRHELPPARWCLSMLFRGAFVAATVWTAGFFLREQMPLVMSLLFTGSLATLLLFATKLLQVSDVMRVVSWLSRRPELPPEESEEEAGTHV